MLGSCSRAVPRLRWRTAPSTNSASARSFTFHPDLPVMIVGWWGMNRTSRYIFWGLINTQTNRRVLAGEAIACLSVAGTLPHRSRFLRYRSRRRPSAMRRYFGGSRQTPHIPECDGPLSGASFSKPNDNSGGRRHGKSDGIARHCRPPDRIAAHRHITAKEFDFRRYGNISRAILVQPRIAVQN